MSCIKKIIDYYFNPKYVIMKGIQIDNRAIMFLGARPVPPKDRRIQIEAHGYIDERYQRLKISFSNQTQTYWKSNIYKKIWTFKQLIKWRRLFDKECDYKCLIFTKGEWSRII